MPFRWQAWEGFSREVTDGPVMSSDPGIVKDFMPGGQYLEFDDECLKTFVSHISFFLSAGVYYFSKIVNYSDLEPLKPASTIVRGVE